NELMDLSKIKSLDRQPLNVKIYEKLKTAIITGDIPPNSKLTETVIAKQMDVSTTPVREAFRRLSSEGLVKTVPWKGIIVQSYSQVDMKNADPCREPTDVVSLRIAVEKVDEKGVAQLEELLEKFKKVETATETFPVTSEIHNTIVSYLGNKKMKSPFT